MLFVQNQDVLGKKRKIFFVNIESILAVYQFLVAQGQVEVSWLHRVTNCFVDHRAIMLKKKNQQVTYFENKDFCSRS